VEPRLEAAAGKYFEHRLFLRTRRIGVRCLCLSHDRLPLSTTLTRHADKVSRSRHPDDTLGSTSLAEVNAAAHSSAASCIARKPPARLASPFLGVPLPKTIFFDGLNLGLRRGTGVATYTRTLANLTRGELGYRTGILYSRQRGFPRRSLDREIAFFDDPAPFHVWHSLKALTSFGNFLISVAGVRPKRIAPTGAVITQPLGINWVPSDEIYAATRIFDRAQGLFVISGMRLKARLSTKADLFHWTYPLPITSNARANIYTLHDLVPMRLPYMTLEWKRYYLRSMRAIAKRADHIVTVSENSKRDIQTYLGVDESRITNTFQAVNIPDHYLARSDDLIADELAGVFGLGMRQYLLFYGSLEPKKNISRILQAYLAADIDIPLVVVTAQSWLAEDETRLLDQIAKDDNDRIFQKPDEGRRIRRYDYMPFRLLVTLIQGARAVVFPSLYEGFGLPVLEAMKLGTPVITSTTSSIPEVAGDATLMVDPYDVDAIRKAIIAVDRDGDLCADLRTRGLRRAEMFSLAAYRERLTKLYASLT